MQLIAKNAVIPESVRIGANCVVERDVVLGEGVQLGVGCVLARGVKVGAGSVLGNYTTVGEGSVLGEQVQIDDHTTVFAGVELGAKCFIGSNSAIGRKPRPAATSTVKVQADLPNLRIGAGSTVGCASVLYAGTEFGKSVFVGDRAVVRERCRIAEKVIVGSGVVVENDTSIGSFTKIQTGSYITAYMQIGENVFIAPMVTTTNDNFMGRTEKRFKFIKGPTIKRGARVGGGSILLPGITVAEETFIAAGALVTKDTLEKKMIKGLPAKEFRVVPEEELLP